jgi:excinuclease ABC subunit B
MKFILNSPYSPAGDQPQAIDGLIRNLNKDIKDQVLLGVTGSGKTYTIANVIEKLQIPTLVISHNKTLAAQLYQEFRDFFPQNAVSYFVSYYDYYQPEAYIPSTDTYIEKETDINDEIDKLRLSATTNLLTRPDVVVVASVSCIYNLGSPVEYGRYVLELIEGQIVSRESIFSRLIDLQYSRSTTDLARGTFRIKGDTFQLWPAYQDQALKLMFMENKIESITPIDPISGKALPPNLNYTGPKRYVIYPAKHYITNPKTQTESIAEIRRDLAVRLEQMKVQGKNIEAYRLNQKVNYDLEMIQEFGFVNGIENYSRYFDGRNPGDPPFTLIDYFHENIKIFKKPYFLTIIDESHITVPQVRGMYFGDRSRKQTLIDFGFRLPAALDNRPLTSTEFLERIGNTIYVSATPDNWEIEYSHQNVVEQLVRPTGLLDPEIEIRPTSDQIPNLAVEILKRHRQGERVLVTTLTKAMAEDLTEFLNDKDKLLSLFPDTADIVSFPKVAYLHSDIVTLDRSDILDSLRRGDYDCLVGINLLREGLDLPEVSLVAILDADKEGFLRSAKSLIQTMGRAARHQSGKVILYADSVTKSMKAAIDEVNRRRDIQAKYNHERGITPTSIVKPIREVLIKREKEKPVGPGTRLNVGKHQTLTLEQIDPKSLTPTDKTRLVKQLNRQMHEAAKDMNYELAAQIRDTVAKLQ